jgi:hypothetical protein
MLSYLNHIYKSIAHLYIMSWKYFWINAKQGLVKQPCYEKH